MNGSTFLASNSEQETNLPAENAVESRTERADECPVCGHLGGLHWFQAPDRFHGRDKNYTVVRCPVCRLAWLSHPPQPNQMHLHYTEAYDRLISRAGENSSERWECRRQTLVQYKQSGSLLDLGCSSGSFLQSLSGNNWSLCGIEMSAESAKKAEANSGAKVFVGDILDAQFPPASFDVITCFDVFEHLYKPRQVMSKVAHWLKPGGIFYLLVPNVDSAEARVFGTYWHGWEIPRHLFHYSPASLQFLAESAGLRKVSIETRRNPAVETSLGYLCDSVFRAVGIKRTALAYRAEARLPWRVIRKLLRMTVLRCLLTFAPLVGGGDSIHAIFVKQSDNDS
jgi:SAM-dependent methyltransferase